MLGTGYKRTRSVGSWKYSLDIVLLNAWTT
jgi:hypothetical protein